MHMKMWRFIFLLLGIALLSLVLMRVDLEAAFAHVQTLGWGIFAILAVYHLAFLADTVSW